MTRVKICGLTRQEDVTLAASLGAAYLGFIFVKESARFIAPEVAGALESPSHAKRVGVFRNASRETIAHAIQHARLDLVQFHGHEPEELVHAVPVPVIRAYTVRDTLPRTDTAASFVMFDTGGGTGRAFDWSMLQYYQGAQPCFLAGGITPHNVVDAIAAKPYAIDLSSGIERAPGVKDHNLMNRLFERVNR
jgi:phosphoribosylanthranilate isomerase